jgi:signal transduction histidine kinase
MGPSEMLEPIAENAALAWPLALTMASVALAGRVRATRRRERINRALHELRRPLQALVLASPGPSPSSGRRHGQLDLALEALGDVDRAVNGGSPQRSLRIANAGELVEDAVGRWRTAAALAGRRIELRWHAGRSRVACEPAAIARALDNLIANALEHGCGPVRVEGLLRTGRLRLLVSDGLRADGAVASGGAVAGPRIRAEAGRRWRGDPRRGHGLRVVAAVAAEHGGRFAACRHGAGTCAVIELPLADTEP